jgi:GntR family transcriptional regulator/MocR family aminotransferase
MPALQGEVQDGLASRHRGAPVAYVGTFSKTVFPSLRLGFCVVPESIADAVINARAIANRDSPIADQAALAEFIAAGHYDRHLRRLRMACQERYEALRHHCAARIPELVLAPVSAGTHVVARVADPRHARGNGGSFALALSRAAAEDDLVVFPLSRYCLETPADDAVVLGFGGVTPRRIAAGVERLARTIAQVRSGPAMRA